MWTYSQSKGVLSQNGIHEAFGYSGSGEGKNNPAAQNQRGIGPIPQGSWKIIGPPVETEKHGPYVLVLLPYPQTETFGRTGFLMHGDSKVHPGMASEGCIIVPRASRQSVWLSGDRELEVVA